MISERSPSVSPPPIHIRPPVITSCQIDDSAFPFSENLALAPIPKPLKAHMSPPSETLLNLDHPCSRYPAHTPSFRERVGHTPALPYFKERDAIDAVTPEVQIYSGYSGTGIQILFPSIKLYTFYRVGIIAEFWYL